MSIINEPKWIEIDLEGDETGERYSGKFLIKPFLTTAEQGDADRLASRYTMGINAGNSSIFDYLWYMGKLKFHIVEHKAEWWKDDGLDMIDKNIGYKIAEEVGILRGERNPKLKPKTDEELAAEAAGGQS